jgi:kynurenine formamidase
MSAAIRMIDVSHTVEHGMVTYKGLPPPSLSQYMSREASHRRYAPGTEFQIGRIDMVGNTGTYVDGPFHRFAHGKDLAALPLESLANLDCVVVRIAADAGRAIDRVPLAPAEAAGRAVLFHTGWDRHWRTDRYSHGHPFLTAGAAGWLADAGVALVGIDSFNIDSVETGERPVHTTLLKHDIPIVEHLRGLRDVPERGGRFFAVPPKVQAFGSFPVRAFVLV